MATIIQPASAIDACNTLIDFLLQDGMERYPRKQETLDTLNRIRSEAEDMDAEPDFDLNTAREMTDAGDAE